MTLSIQELRRKLNSINKRHGATWDIPDELWQEIESLLQDQIRLAKIDELMWISGGLYRPVKKDDTWLLQTIQERIKALTTEKGKKG